MGIPLREIKGLGPKTEGYLHSQGIDTIEALLSAPQTILLSAPRMSESRAREIMENAKALMDFHRKYNVKGSNKSSYESSTDETQVTEKDVFYDDFAVINIFLIGTFFISIFFASAADDYLSWNQFIGLFIVVVFIFFVLVVIDSIKPIKEQWLGTLGVLTLMIPVAFVMTFTLYQLIGLGTSWHDKPWYLLSSTFLDAPDMTSIQKELVEEQASFYEKISQRRTQ